MQIVRTEESLSRGGRLITAFTSLSIRLISSSHSVQAHSQTCFSRRLFVNLWDILCIREFIGCIPVGGGLGRVTITLSARSEGLTPERPSHGDRRRAQGQRHLCFSLISLIHISTQWGWNLCGVLVWRGLDACKLWLSTVSGDSPGNVWPKARAGLSDLRR